MITSPAITSGTASRPKLSPDGKTTITIPITLRRLGGRKQVMTQSAQPQHADQTPHVDQTLVKALARAHRWRIPVALASTRLTIISVRERVSSFPSASLKTMTK